MKDRETLIVYLPAATKRAIEKQADEDQAVGGRGSASEVARGVLVAHFGPKNPR